MSDLVKCDRCGKMQDRKDVHPAGRNKAGQPIRECKACREKMKPKPKPVAAEPTTTPKVCAECGAECTARLCPKCWDEWQESRDKELAREQHEKRLKEIPEIIAKGVGRRYSSASLDNVDLPDGMAKKITALIKARGSLLLSGPNGTGKTHIACGIYRMALEAGVPVKFALVPDLLSELRAAIEKNETEYVISRYRKIGILILDDLGAERPTEWVIEQLCRVLDWRYRDDAQTIFTTNLSKDEIGKQYGPRIASRISGLIGKNLVTLGGRDRRGDPS